MRTCGEGGSGFLKIWVFFVSVGPVAQCPRRNDTPPGENEKEEDFANTGSNRNAKLHRKVGRKEALASEQKCVIWFQEGSQILN